MDKIKEQILGTFLSKVGEIIADFAHNKLESYFKLNTFKTLQKNLKSLSVKACDVEEQIRNAECSGKKKRKREVEEWLGEVKSIETQVVEVGTPGESHGYIPRWWTDGRKAAQLNEQVCKLLQRNSEDREVDQEKLIREFISEGLLDTREGRRAQFDQGHVILDKLVNVCLFELGKYKRVKMHDLVRGMALKVCEGKYMVRAGDLSLKEIPKEEEWTEDLEKVSLMCNNIRRIEDGTSPNCPNLSTLLLPYNPLEFIHNSFFCKMQGLRTLDLRYTIILELPDSLSGLKSLKALLLEHCWNLEYVPYLGNLKALRELNLSHTAIKEVPQGVEELLNLRLLSMEGAHKLKVLRRGLLHKLGSLQYMSFPYRLEASIEGVENLKELEEFRGTIKNVRAFNCFIESY